ncbi:DUF4230 domain-containing protein [Prevotella pectinovora]|jgi:hypothetical protein|uniref:DUF4230 domain-containing protein n=1 Tax=Prevotella pectinovora TaxID=1602169 RepID=UPI00307ADBD9
MMNRLYFNFLIVFAALAVAGCSRKQTPQQQPESVDTIPMLVMQVQKCSRLYTAEYKMHKIITHDDEIRMKGKFLNQDYNVALPMGSRKIAIPIDATVKAYIDLSSFSEKNVRRVGDKIDVTLPDPRIEMTSSRINHGEIRKYVALTRQNFSDKEMAGYEQQGRQAIINDIPQTGIMEMAKESAARVMVPFFVGMGFNEKDITISFRKDFSDNEIKKMIVTASDAERK